MVISGLTATSKKNNLNNQPQEGVKFTFEMKRFIGTIQASE